jgi:hypothetical protein
MVPPRGRIERTGPPFDYPAPTVPEADQFVAVLAFALAHDGPDDGVEARAVTATGQYAHPHARTLSDRIAPFAGVP